MGHRALVAYGRSDDRYDVHYSHWGAHGLGLGLACELTRETPFGGGTNGPAVEREPIATGLALAEIRSEHVDFQQYKAFYVVTPEFAVTAYRTLWFGLDSASGTIERSAAVGNGALIAVGRDDPADERLRAWFRGTKAVVSDLVDRGAIAEPEARAYLANRVRGWAGDREVIVVDR